LEDSIARVAQESSSGPAAGSFLELARRLWEDFQAMQFVAADLRRDLRFHRDERLSRARQAQTIGALTEWGPTTFAAGSFCEAVKGVASVLRKIFDSHEPGSGFVPMFRAFYRFSDAALRYDERAEVLNMEPNGAEYFLLAEFALSASALIDAGQDDFWRRCYSALLEAMPVYAARYADVPCALRNESRYRLRIASAEPPRDAEGAAKRWADRIESRGLPELDELTEHHGERLLICLCGKTD
ncbi:MAG: hypothetical protein AAFZ65_01575, partial [Planctomycetota bacterium]